MDHDLILASTSPYRRALLARLELPFTCVTPHVDETRRDHETAQALACRLAREKALAVSEQHPSALVLGSDQTAALGDAVLNKPLTEERAVEQLRACSGNVASFYTAVALCHEGRVIAESSCETVVTFRDLRDEEIRGYVQRDQPLDCAGSFRWEGIGISLFHSLRSDDPTALEGLPLITVVEMLRKSEINPIIP